MKGKPPEDSPRFPMGIILMTPGAIAACESAGDEAGAFLACHERGDWGTVSSEDRGRNEQALVDGSRLVSAYRLKNDVKLWIITEADRRSTTILLPHEY